MARRECDEQNERTIHDNISNSDVTLYYRMPTNIERQEYFNTAFSRRKNKIENNMVSARIESGMKILTGFKVGGFERKVDGKYVAFSAVEGEENYYAEWKEWIKKNAADLIGQYLAPLVFDAPASTLDDEEDIEGK